MKPELLHILRHSLGLDDNGHGREYRNHFATGPETSDWPFCIELCRLGFMSDGGPLKMWGGMHCFQVTEKGKEEARKLAPVEKISRSRRRYLDFLAADSGLRFGEWLKRGSIVLCLLCLTGCVHKPVLVKPSLMPPASTRAVSTNRPPPVPQNYVVQFPPTETNVTYNIWRSTNLVTWALFRTNVVGPNSTAGDIYTTNDFRTSEYFRAVRVPPTTKSIGKIPGLRWDLDPSVKTIQ